MLGELDIPFDVFTTFFAHMLTLSTVVLIQVYINYIKKLLKVGSILFPLLLSHQSVRNRERICLCPCNAVAVTVIIAVALIRRICPLMRRSLLHKQSRHLFWSFLLLPLRSLLRSHVYVDNAVAVATAAATTLIVVDVAIFAAVDVSSASAYAVAGSVAAAATLDVLFYLYLC